MARSGMAEDGIAVDATKTVDFTIVVWPTRLPTHLGQLADLDAGTVSVDLIGQGQFTIRFAESATATGSAWDSPKDVFECVTLDNVNYDDFVTGYTQILFTAKDDKLTCEETIKLVKSENAADAGTEVEFTIKVDKKVCEIVVCPTGEVQDAYMCGCMEEPASQGVLMDFDTATSRTARFVNPGDFVTMRENSLTTEGRTYNYEQKAVADVTLNCVKEISRTDTGYWRQVIYEGVTENCIDTISRTNLVSSVAEVLEFRVYPQEDPLILGTYFDMDYNPNREISVASEGYFTIRVNEGATANGYAWDTPTEDTLAALECVDVQDSNYGDYKTGYIQYVFKAKNVDAYCVDTFEVTRSSAWTPCEDCASVDTITISVSTVVAADPTSTSTSIINDDDSAEVVAAKENCLADD